MPEPPSLSAYLLRDVPAHLCAAETSQHRHPPQVHIAGVFASGLLVKEGGTYAYQAASAEQIACAGRWRLLGKRHGCSLPAVAIAFAALPKCVCF